MTRNTSKRLAASTVLAGCAVIISTPAYAAVAPEAEPPGLGGQPPQSVIDHYLADTSGSTSSVPGVLSAQTKAQIEHDEGIAGSPGMAAQVKAKIEAMERAQQDPQQAAKSGTGSSSGSSDPSSVPVTVLMLLGGGLVAGAAGYTVYRFRHHGPVGAATA